MEPDEDIVVTKRLSVDARPPWSDVTSAGTFRVEPDGSFDRHFHDCDEYWLVFAGHARVLVGTRTFDVGPGDIVCTPTGTVHDVVAVRETLEAFWFEGRPPKAVGSGTCTSRRRTRRVIVVPRLMEGAST